MGTEKYLRFDEFDGEWKETSLEELAVLNDPTLKIYIETTYEALLAGREKRQEIHVTAAPPEEIVAEYMPMEKTMHYIRAVTSRAIFVVLFFGYLCAASWLCIGAFKLGGIYLLPFAVVFSLAFPSLYIQYSPRIKEALRKRKK